MEQASPEEVLPLGAATTAFAAVWQQGFLDPLIKQVLEGLRSAGGV